MADISKFLALEVADNWEVMAAADPDLSRRRTLRECADLIRMLAEMPEVLLTPRRQPDG